MNLRTVFLVAFFVADAAAGACDPVHSDAVAALGGEAPGVRHGPLHRPGQPCLLCHSDFSVAGTVFANAEDRQPAPGVVVTLTDSQGHTFAAPTNAAGNFYVSHDQFEPIYPMKAALEFGGTTVNMVADIGRNGACASCHFDPAGPASPGHVYAPADGVTP
jgi:hypothetical protein